MAELAGVMVGNYFLLERLRHEGMVETYLARPTIQGGYDVHLRLFRPSFPDPSAFQEHFPVEVRKVWHCRHEHIQPLLEFGEGSDLLYTITRVEEAPTLEQLLEGRGDAELPLPVVARLITQICDALQYAHERGIVHGNLQPSSILVDPDWQVRLTDFAFKRASLESATAFAQVEEGNAAYIAPEQVVGLLEPASDIYALGVLLFRLLGGCLPYDGESAGEIAMLHAKEPIPSVRALRPNLAESVEMVVRMALAKDAASRFSAPRELAAAFLKALATDQPPPAPIFSSQRIPVKARHTRLTWARAFSLLALLLILAGLGSTFSLVSFSAFPPGSLPGLPLNLNGSRSLFPGIPPLLSLEKQPALPQASGEGVASPLATPRPTSRPGITPGATPGVTPTPGVVRSPIVSVATPTPVSLTCVSGTLKVGGSFYLAPLLTQIGADYTTFCSGFHQEANEHGCKANLKTLIKGESDLASCDLSVPPAVGLTDYPVAALLYAVIVSPDVQISGLSSAQLQAIYQGQITNWSQVGGPDEAIVILQHAASDPLRAIFQAFVLNGTPEHPGENASIENASPEHLAQRVAQTAGAITYVPLSAASSAQVQVLAINQAQPGLRGLLQGTYNFWSVEHLYVYGPASSSAQAYIQFLLSDQESNRLAQVGAIPFSLLTPDLQSSHLPGPFISPG